MSSNFQIEPAATENSERIHQYLLDSFYNGGEPLNQYLEQKLQEKPSTKERGIQYINRITEGLSFVAVSSKFEIIGLCINKQFKGYEKIETKPDGNAVTFQSIGKLINIFHEQIEKDEERLGEGEKRLDIDIISVHPDWRSKGVAFALTEKTINFAKENGFSQIRSVCSSAYSARLFEKFGFRCIHSLKYENYKDNNGEIIFKLPLPHTHLKDMMLRI